MRDLVVFCADVGSLKSGHFGWARSPSGYVDEPQPHEALGDGAQHVVPTVRGRGYRWRVCVHVADARKLVGPGLCAWPN